ncbi:Protein PHOTOPERIOD-INDEPENDENT EARLY FLOWERING 1 [Porphyridium purpureum]|uniref:Protein PHOTOPERIOD-INDEPENDENT EARLY FLOWERING 1 n=1 Tax=Porphyridium purpureum TaxID=35688 RepID=A0A5J4YNV4_PORPP|nr:Protein PHOTOPERIOD-INDEPENDENT EARLY FLOWERING 1 [Porphyridium purpureum]|eukprot:POR2477..scf222_8
MDEHTDQQNTGASARHSDSADRRTFEPLPLPQHASGADAAQADHQVQTDASKAELELQEAGRHFGDDDQNNNSASLHGAALAERVVVKLAEVSVQASGELERSEFVLKQLGMRRMARLAARRAEQRMLAYHAAASARAADNEVEEDALKARAIMPGEKSVQRIPDVSLSSVRLLADANDTNLTLEQRLIMVKASEINKRNAALARERLPPQPVPPRAKTHWDYVLDEMSWMSTDYREEFKWRNSARRRVNKAVAKYFDEEDERRAREIRELHVQRRRTAAGVARHVRKFWAQVQELVRFKAALEQEQVQKRVREQELDALLDQTVAFSSKIADNLNPLKHEPLRQAAKRSQTSRGGGDVCEDQSSSNSNNSSNSSSSTSAMNVSDDYEAPVDEDAMMDDEATMQEAEQYDIEQEEQGNGVAGDVSRRRKEETAQLEHEAEMTVEELLRVQGIDPDTYLQHSKDKGGLRTAKSDASVPRSVQRAERAIAPLSQDITQTKRSGRTVRRTEAVAALGVAGGSSDRSGAGEKVGSESKSGSESVAKNGVDLAGVGEDPEYTASEDGAMTDDEQTMQVEEETAAMHAQQEDKDLNIERENELEHLARESEVPLEQLLKEYLMHGEPDSSDDERAASSDGRSGGEREATGTDQDDESGPEIGESTSMLIAHRELGKNGKKKTEECAPPNEEGTDMPDSKKDQFGNSSTADIGEQLRQIAEEREIGVTRLPSELLRGSLRSYQHVGLDWLVALYNNHLNGILADEMGLGKTIMTIALLCWLAVEQHHWGPHLIVVPTSVMLNWEVELKKFAPGLKVLTYFGSMRERKLKRQGWSKHNAFHVCITSYQLAVNDAAIFRRKKWTYLVLDEAQNIKNFASLRWQTLMTFKTRRRLLLTGTPLQNSVMELWSLMHFLMPDIFNSHSEFKAWFSSPLNENIDVESADDCDGAAAAAAAERKQKVALVVKRLHGVLRPFMLRRLKSHVERGLPPKREQLVRCTLSKRQRLLYEDFVSRADTKAALASGNAMSVMNVLLQLRKVCNHPDLFEPRPIVSPFVQRALFYPIPRQAVLALAQKDESYRALPLFLPNYGFDLAAKEASEHVLFRADSAELREISASCASAADAMEAEAKQLSKSVNGKSTFTSLLPSVSSSAAPVDASSEQEDEVRAAVLSGPQLLEHAQDVATGFSAAILHNLALLTRLRGSPHASGAIYGQHLIEAVSIPLKVSSVYDSDIHGDQSDSVWDVMLPRMEVRAEQARIVSEKFGTCVTLVRAPIVECRMMRDYDSAVTVSHARTNQVQALRNALDPYVSLFRAQQVRSEMALPDARLIQWDCGKLQALAELLRNLHAGGHRCLIFSQMTRVLDVLETFLNLYGWRYLRLDGATRTDNRQRLVERFNTDAKLFCMILSTRSGGVGLNLTGADSVIFYDSDWNPAIDAQAQDRAHRIGQTRPVTVYRLVTDRTVEWNIMHKAQQKRNLESLVISDAGFTTDNYASAALEFQSRGTIASLSRNDSEFRGLPDFDSTGSGDNVLARLARMDVDADLDAGQEELARQMRENALREKEQFKDDFEGEDRPAGNAPGSTHRDAGKSISGDKQAKVGQHREPEQEPEDAVRITGLLNAIQKYAIRYVETFGLDVDSYRSMSRKGTLKRVRDGGGPIAGESALTGEMEEAERSEASDDEDEVRSGQHGAKSLAKGEARHKRRKHRSGDQLNGSENNHAVASEWKGNDDLVYEIDVSDRATRTDYLKARTDPVVRKGGKDESAGAHSVHGTHQLNLFLPLRDGGPEEMVGFTLSCPSPAAVGSYGVSSGSHYFVYCHHGLGYGRYGTVSAEDAAFFRHAYARLSRMPHLATSVQRETAARRMVALAKRDAKVGAASSHNVAPIQGNPAQEGAPRRELVPSTQGHVHGTSGVSGASGASTSSSLKSANSNGAMLGISSVKGLKGPAGSSILKSSRASAPWTEQEDRALVYRVLLANPPLSMPVAAHMIGLWNGDRVRGTFNCVTTPNSGIVSGVRAAAGRGGTGTRTAAECEERLRVLHQHLMDRREWAPDAVIAALHRNTGQTATSSGIASKEQLHQRDELIPAIFARLLPSTMPKHMIPASMLLLDTGGEQHQKAPLVAHDSHADAKAAMEANSAIVKVADPTDSKVSVAVVSRHAAAQFQAQNENASSPMHLHRPGFKVDECASRRRVLSKSGSYPEHRLKALKASIASAAYVASQAAAATGFGGVYAAHFAQEHRGMRPGIVGAAAAGGPLQPPKALDATVGGMTQRTSSEVAARAGVGASPGTSAPLKRPGIMGSSGSGSGQLVPSVRASVLPGATGGANAAAAMKVPPLNGTAKGAKTVKAGAAGSSVSKKRAISDISKAGAAGGGNSTVPSTLASGGVGGKGNSGKMQGKSAGQAAELPSAAKMHLQSQTNNNLQATSHAAGTKNAASSSAGSAPSPVGQPLVSGSHPSAASATGGGSATGVGKGGSAPAAGASLASESANAITSPNAMASLPGSTKAATVQKPTGPNGRVVKKTEANDTTK